MNWKDLLKKLFTPSNLRKVGKVAYDAANKQADKMEKDKAKSGLADIALVCIVAMTLMAFQSICASRGKGGVGFGDRMNAVTVSNSTNCTVNATVSPTGGGSLSVPVGGGK